MAKAKTESATAVATATSNERPTPDNTPAPGGGSWKWDDAVPGWVEKTPDPATEQAAVESAPQPSTSE